MRKQRKIVVTVSAVIPNPTPYYSRAKRGTVDTQTVTRFYSVPPDDADIVSAHGRAFMAAQLGLELSAVNVTAKPFKKLHYAWHYDARGEWTTDEYNADRAKKYALWLAERDGIALPNSKAVRAVWSGFYSGHKKRGHRHYDGSVRQHATHCRRVCAVEWGHEEERYNTRKDGRRGAWTHNEWVAELRIDIPHWDFEASPAIEELDTARAA